jgi:hypothetical protein
MIDAYQEQGPSLTRAEARVIAIGGRVEHGTGNREHEDTQALTPLKP